MVLRRRRTGILAQVGGGEMTVFAKETRPESLREARTWEIVKGKYAALGLCGRCAAQAAWGHQIGFGRLEHQPCAACAPVVATLPVATASPAWRRRAQGAAVLSATETPGASGKDKPAPVSEVGVPR